MKALQLRAQQRGLALSNEVTHYLLTHVSRSMSDLVVLLDKLDYESLAEQRKLTIPFIKKYMGRTEY
jgi:DnaA family protein